MDLALQAAQRLVAEVLDVDVVDEALQLEPEVRGGVRAAEPVDRDELDAVVVAVVLEQQRLGHVPAEPREVVDHQRVHRGGPVEDRFLELTKPVATGLRGARHRLVREDELVVEDVLLLVDQLADVAELVGDARHLLRGAGVARVGSNPSVHLRLPFGHGAVNTGW
nr:hypothetical protein [Anaeromyxobacter sp. SG26]